MPGEDADLFAAIGDRACPLKDSGAVGQMVAKASAEGCRCPH